MLFLLSNSPCNYSFLQVLVLVLLKIITSLVKVTHIFGEWVEVVTNCHAQTYIFKTLKVI